MKVIKIKIKDTIQTEFVHGTKSNIFLYICSLKLRKITNSKIAYHTMKQEPKSVYSYMEWCSNGMLCDNMVQMNNFEQD